MSKKENKKKKKNNKTKSKKAKIIIVVLLVILVALVCFTYKFIKNVEANGGGMQGVLATLMGHDENTLENLEEIRVLVLGISTDIDTELTDTIMVASYNPKTQSASLLSIPRDTFVGDSKKNVSASDKINAIYAKKGINGVLEKVNDLTGLNIKYYVIVRTDGLRELVDTIGGVEFDVPTDMYYNDDSQNLHINLKKGLQTLNGSQAEQLVRFRKNDDNTGYSSEYGSDDYGRMRTQREFIKAVMEQTLQAKNITKVFDLLDIVYDNIETNISIEVAKDYVPYIVNFNSDNLKADRLPGASVKWQMKNGNNIWVFESDEEETEELLSEMFTYSSESADNTESEEVDLSSIKIEVLNGSGSKSNLTEVVKILKDAGFTISKQSTTTTTSKTTIINKGGCNDSITKQIVSLLDGGTTTNSSSTSGVDYTIIIGEDY